MSAGGPVLGNPGVSRISPSKRPKPGSVRGSPLHRPLLSAYGLKLSASVGDLSGSGWAPLPPPGDIGVGNYDPKGPYSRTLRGPQSAHLPTSGERETEGGRPGVQGPTSPAFRVPPQPGPAPESRSRDGGPPPTSTPLLTGIAVTRCQRHGRHSTRVGRTETPGTWLYSYACARSPRIRPATRP